MRLTVLCTDLGIRLPGDKGASMHLQAITTALGECGHDVQLVGVAGHGTIPDRLAAAVSSLVLLPHPGRSEGLERERRKLAFADLVADEVRSRVIDFAPNAIYERLSLFGDAGLRLADLTGAAHLVEVNALLSREDAAWRGLQLAGIATRRERRVLESADALVVVSRELAGQISDSMTPRRVEVVPNGVDLEAFSSMVTADVARARFGLALSDRIVTFVGALRPWHGVDLAIRALAATTSAATLVIAGDGPVRAELERLAEHLGVADRVVFLGQLAHSQVPCLLAASDVAIAPYPETDDFAFSPLKLYEYLASGVPVIASRIGQIPEILDDGRFGTLVPAGEVGALAAAIDRVLTTDDARPLAAAARAHAWANHGWSNRAEQIVQLLTTEVVARASSR